MRMLMNNLDPEVAEHPEKLVVYGSHGQAARSWADFDAIVSTLQRLEPDQTLLVQSGRPVGVVQTHEDSLGPHRQLEPGSPGRRRSTSTTSPPRAS